MFRSSIGLGHGHAAALVSAMSASDSSSGIARQCVSLVMSAPYQFLDDPATREDQDAIADLRQVARSRCWRTGTTSPVGAPRPSPRRACWRAPTSTPCVGSSSSSSFGPVCSHLAIRTFCGVAAAERARASAPAGWGGRHRRRRAPRRAGRWPTSRVPTGSENRRGRAATCCRRRERADAGGAEPVGGQESDPGVDGAVAAVHRRATSRVPPISIVPARAMAARRRADTGTSSEPEPIRPVSPTISPRRNSNEHVFGRLPLEIRRCAHVDRTHRSRLAGARSGTSSPARR